jgi:hypothetical protein
VREFARLRRVEVPRLGRYESSEGQKLKRVSATRLGLARVRCERTRGGTKASKQVKLVEGAIPSLVTQGDRETGLRTRGKVVYSSRGIQATASKAWESVKRWVIRSSAARFRSTVDNCREASGLGRGARSLRGENSEEG